MAAESFEARHGATKIKRGRMGVVAAAIVPYLKAGYSVTVRHTDRLETPCVVLLTQGQVTVTWPFPTPAPGWLLQLERTLSAYQPGAVT